MPWNGRVGARYLGEPSASSGSRTSVVARGVASHHGSVRIHHGCVSHQSGGLRRPGAALNSAAASRARDCEKPPGFSYGGASEEMRRARDARWNELHDGSSGWPPPQPKRVGAYGTTRPPSCGWSGASAGRCAPASCSCVGTASLSDAS